MAGNADIVRAFIATWSSLDAQRLAAYFCEDGVYHNMPAAPMKGRAQIAGFIGAFIKPWTSTTWDILNLVEAGNVVMVERLDCTRVGEKAVDLPCCGVFEMRDGKIAVWRDYFDMATYTRALAG